MLAKPFEESSKQSRNKCVDISRNDLDDDDEQVVDEGKPLDSERCGRELAT